MKAVLNTILTLLIVYFLYDSFQIEVNAKSAIHQILSSMATIKALLAGLIIAVINRRSM